MGLADYATRGAVAVITLDNPPVNGLGHELRRGLVSGLDRAAADPAVKAIVLVGAGKGFSGGADIKEFGTPKMTAEPSLHSVIRAVESSLSTASNSIESRSPRSPGDCRRSRIIP